MEINKRVVMEEGGCCKVTSRICSRGDVKLIEVILTSDVSLLFTMNHFEHLLNAHFNP